MVRELDAFLLSREWRDGPDGVELTLWATSAEGPVRASFRRQEAVAFVPRQQAARADRREPVALRTREGLEVDALYFRSQRALVAERERLRASLGVMLESDVKPSDRFLMERFVQAGMAIRGDFRRHDGVLRVSEPQIRTAEVRPTLSLLALDIETDGWDGPLLSLALAGEGVERVLIVGSGEPRTTSTGGAITFHATERDALLASFAEIQRLDPDVLAGWNVVEFDLTALEKRCNALGIPLAIGRSGERSRVIPGATAQQLAIARVPGRVVLDGIATLKNATFTFERYSLDYVSRELLGRGKRIRATSDPVAEIRRMHREDPDALAEYNLEDCRLVKDVFTRAGLVPFAIERARLTGLPLDRAGGSVAAFDHLYLPRLHRRGFVAPDVGVEIDAGQAPGGQVLESVPGLFRNVLALDFRSLYPSLIRTFQIDPLALWDPGDDPVPGFDGASFARHGAILPDIVAGLAEARVSAQRAGDADLSRAIKILMNSFYGVLGTPGCRFFDLRLASSITRRGHDIVERTVAQFEERGLRVLYGDTDSFFVHAGDHVTEEQAAKLGAELAVAVNTAWRERIASEHGLTSFLDLRFDACFVHFLMPTMRGSERGTKKRYAGAVRKPDGSLELVIRGLEAVRTDWTPLARDAQRELLRRAFSGEPFDAWLRKLRTDLLEGALDDRLVYRRRLRRDLDEYAAGASAAPPHVRAARLARERDVDEAEIGSRDEVEYVMTTRGPEPLAARTAPIDYAHYLEKQLAPACDVLLGPLGTSFVRVAGAQLALF